MTEEKTVKIIGLVFLSAIMITFAYLFTLAGETAIPLILLFIGIVLALIVGSSAYHPKK